MKRAISLLLILTTLLGCCAGFFSCKPKDDDTVDGIKTLDNKSEVILDLTNSSKLSEHNLQASTDKVTAGETASAKWSFTQNNASRRLTLNFEKTDLSDYKEVAFWIYNDSKESINFQFSFITSDDKEHKIYAEFKDPVTPTKKYVVNTITVHPGWHEYKIPFSETDAYKDKTWQYDVPNPTSYEDYFEEFEANVRFDTSAIKAIKLDAAATPIESSSVNFYITSIRANSQKTGTIKGYYFGSLANAVCFYEDSNAYLYNQNRYVYSLDENVRLKADSDTTYVPIAVLAQHRGASITTNTKDKVEFTYNGKSYSYSAGQKFDYVGCEAGLTSGVAHQSTSSTVGDYLTIPMEVAASDLGYQLFYDQMGLAVFSDIPNIFVDNNDPNYKGDDEKDSIPGYQYHTLFNIIEIIAFKNYTGEELIDDMNELHPEDEHPRILLNQDQFDNLKKLLKEDPIYSSWFARQESRYAKGTTNYNSKSPFFDMRGQYHMLDVAREVMEELLIYSFFYKMTDNEDYAEKVKKTMLAAIRFTDNDLTGRKSWHPEHFLDTSEMMYGYALAYDWCYDYLAKDKDDLKAIEDGIWEYGYGATMGFGELAEWYRDISNMQKVQDERLAAGEPAWNNTESSPLYNIASTTWTHKGTPGSYTPATRTIPKFNFNPVKYTFTNNWSAVCNAGIMTMALAFANVNPAYRAASEYLLDCALYLFPPSLFESYAPDGGYPEGPGYWAYGTSYSMRMFTALECATGTDLGFASAPGFYESFVFYNATGSLSNGNWAYHDAGTGSTVTSSELFFWYSYDRGDNSMAKLRYETITSGKAFASKWDLMFYSPDAISGSASLNLDYCYSEIGVITFRSAWTEDALFCGLHGGDNAESHGQLDIGNFIIEHGGTQFFVDLGKDEYNIKGYGAGQTTYFTEPYRYWYYRNRAEGHNVLIIDPTKVDTSKTNKGQSNQGRNYDSNLDAVSEVLRFESGKTSALAVIDMGCAYYDANKSVVNPRGMLVTENRSTVVIQDETKLTRVVDEVLWQGHVVEGGKITVLGEDKRAAIIEYEGKSLLCEIVLPEGYDVDWKFEVRAADYHPETGLVMTPGEYDRDGLQKLVAIAHDVTEIKIAVVCRLLSDGPHSYTWTDIADWQVDR